MCACVCMYVGRGSSLCGTQERTWLNCPGLSSVDFGGFWEKGGGMQHEWKTLRGARLAGRAEGPPQAHACVKPSCDSLGPRRILCSLWTWCWTAQGYITAPHWSSLRRPCSISSTRASWPPIRCPSWRRYLLQLLWGIEHLLP